MHTLGYLWRTELCNQIDFVDLEIWMVIPRKWASWSHLDLASMCSSGLWCLSALYAQLCRRFYVELLGKNRIKLLDLWEQDGYRVAKVATMKDENDDTDRSDIIALCGEVKAIVMSSLGVLRWILYFALSGLNSFISCAEYCEMTG